MKKFLAILLSLCCLFLVGCGKDYMINFEKIVMPQQKTYKDTITDKEYFVWEIYIEFSANYNIENLILELPVYTYEEGHALLNPGKFNKFELCKAEIMVGTVLKDEEYRITHKISEKDYEILANNNIKVDIGTPTVKSGEII